MGPTSFTWFSKKQPIVALSSCEAEYVAVSLCICHAIWLRKLLENLCLPQQEVTKIHIDNKSAIMLAKNPIHHQRSKHIDIRYHFIQEHIKEKAVELIHVKTKNQVADIFTKPLVDESFNKFKGLLGMKAT